MKSKYKILIVALLAVSTMSCKKWLDVQPATSITASELFSKEAGFKDALNGVYSLMTLPGAYGGEMTMAYADVLGQTYDNIAVTPGHVYAFAAAYNYTANSEAARLTAIWSQQYKAIVNANLILKEAEINKAVFTGQNYSLVKGEALALRAYLHFDLLRLFAPNPVTGKSLKAIPYANAYTNVPFSQSTVEEVISKVIADLKDARDLLKVADPMGPAAVPVSNASLAAGNRAYAMNYYAATALMARVYLYAGDNANALLMAKEAIAATSVSWFTTPSSAYIFPTEHFFALNITNLFTQSSSLYFPTLYSAQNTGAFSITSSTLTAIYAAGVNTDYRYNWFQTVASNINIVSKFNNNSLMPMLKLSEMYLIAAESEPNTSTAVSQYINPLRAHRGLSPLDPATTTSALLKAEIEKQYRGEFVGEGQLFYYYKRLNTQKLPTLPAFTNSDLIYTMPVPQIEIQFGKIG